MAHEQSLHQCVPLSASFFPPVTLKNGDNHQDDSSQDCVEKYASLGNELESVVQMDGEVLLQLYEVYDVHFLHHFGLPEVLCRYEGWISHVGIQLLEVGENIVYGHTEPHFRFIVTFAL